MDNFDFGELKNDTNLIGKMKTVDEAISKIEDTIKAACQITNYDELTTEEKVKYDLFLSYSINSLFFMYLKMNGIDSSNHGIKNELNRVKELMLQEKQARERKNRPKVDQEAAKRFIRSGLHDHKRKNEEFRQKHQSGNKNQQPNKKKRFN